MITFDCICFSKVIYFFSSYFVFWQNFLVWSNCITILKILFLPRLILFGQTAIINSRKLPWSISEIYFPLNQFFRELQNSAPQNLGMQQSNCFKICCFKICFLKKILKGHSFRKTGYPETKFVCLFACNCYPTDFSNQTPFFTFIFGCTWLAQ